MPERLQRVLIQTAPLPDAFAALNEFIDGWPKDVPGDKVGNAARAHERGKGAIEVHGILRHLRTRPDMSDHRPEFHAVCERLLVEGFGFSMEESDA